MKRVVPLPCEPFVVQSAAFVHEIADFGKKLFFYEKKREKRLQGKNFFVFLLQ
jgi:hypothetical protein